MAIEIHVSDLEELLLWYGLVDQVMQYGPFDSVFISRELEKGKQISEDVVLVPYENSGGTVFCKNCSSTPLVHVLNSLDRKILVLNLPCGETAEYLFPIRDLVLEIGKIVTYEFGYVETDILEFEVRWKYRIAKDQYGILLTVRYSARKDLVEIELQGTNDMTETYEDLYKSLKELIDSWSEKHKTKVCLYAHL